MTHRLEKLICLVTGGSTGIGAAVAREFAQQGATVLITGRHEETLRVSAAQHPAIRYLVADVSKPADSGRVIEELRTRYGRLDVLVNNAGIAPIRPLSDASPDHVREVLEVNVIGLVEITRQALPLLTASKGNVINVASILADKPFANMSVYSASKAAVVALSRSWAQELATHGIRVNVVSPGPIDTPIYGKMGLSSEAFDGLAASVLALVPSRRFGTPAEVAPVVAFLASSDASFVTGARYTVGGGIEA